jgi:uncharacterized membrane protein YecN with MAPEG domain
VFATVRKSQGSGILRLQMKGVKLKNVEGFFSKSDPFFELAKKIDAAGGQTWYVPYTHIHLVLKLEGERAYLVTLHVC